MMLMQKDNIGVRFDAAARRDLPRALCVGKNEDIANFNSLGNPIGSLLADCNNSIDPLAYSLVVIDPFSHCWNHNGCDPGLSEEHSFLAGKNLGLQGKHITSGFKSCARRKRGKVGTATNGMKIRDSHCKT